MNKYKYKATNLIAERFESDDIEYSVSSVRRQEDLDVLFPVDGGGMARISFISRDDDNDISVRIFGIVSNIPAGKIERMQKYCNKLNQEYRFVCFYIDEDHDLNLRYDFLRASSDESIGNMARELFIRLMYILDDKFEEIMETLYSSPDERPMSALA